MIEPFAQLLHISDIHLTEQITMDPRWFSRPQYLLRAKPHSFEKLEAFTAAVRKLRFERSPAFDVVLDTGDITTDGSSGAFQTAKHFLAEEYVCAKMRTATEGLNAAAQRRVGIPGNHDRFTRSWLPVQANSRVFEQTFGVSDPYPFVVGFRRPERPNARDEPALLFFAFDSTPSPLVSYLPFSAWGLSWFKPWSITARGRIESAECRKMVSLADKVRNDGTVQSTDGKPMAVDYDMCVRIAALHHHPLDQNPTSLMENNEEFIDKCLEAEIDIVLFGHDHKRYEYPIPRRNGRGYVHFYCCPSTLEYSATNGFYRFEFFRDRPSGFGGFIFEHHQWFGSDRGFELEQQYRERFDRPL